jgi:hypothetical protein
MTLLRVRRWRGFKVEIWNSGARHRLRYEWKIYPLSGSLKRMLAYKGKLYRVIHDHTSTYDALECWIDAKGKINELRDFERLLNVDVRLNRWHSEQ